MKVVGPKKIVYPGKVEVCVLPEPESESEIVFYHDHDPCS